MCRIEIEATIGVNTPIVASISMSQYYHTVTTVWSCVKKGQ